MQIMKILLIPVLMFMAVATASAGCAGCGPTAAPKEESCSKDSAKACDDKKACSDEKKKACSDKAKKEAAKKPACCPAK